MAAHAVVAFILLVALLAARSEAAQHVSRLSRLGQVLGFKIQPGLNITVTPDALNGTGAVVTVAWTGHQFPEYTDWIGVWCSAGATFDPSATAPVKYQDVGSVPTYKQGYGSFNFFMINQRADCTFALLTGGAQYPLVLGVSNTLRFLQPNIPTGLRIALVNDTTMRVAWNSLNAAQPGLYLSLTASFAKSQTYPASTDSYAVSDMCVEPATQNGWRPPGQINNVLVPMLAANTQYYYKVGDLAAPTDPNVWSPVSTFTTPPLTGSVPPGNVIRLVAFGDLGNADEAGALQHSWDYNNHGEINALNTTRRVYQEIKGAMPSALVLHIGDIAYSVGFLSEWDQFLEQISPAARQVPWMTAIGNHEIGNPASFVPSSDSGGECGIPYSRYFRMPAPADTGAPATPWYTFAYGIVRVVVMSTEHDFTTGSTQHAWLASTLASVDRKATPWLIFAGHRPMYVDSMWNDDPASDQAIAAVMRQHVEPLLVNAKVDLAIWGHHHTYQRTCAVRNTTCTAGSPVHLVIGMAGYDLTHNLEPKLPPYMVVATDAAWGYTRMSIDRTQLRVEFVSDTDMTVKDEFVLQHP